MPGVRPKSQANTLPELGRIRTAILTSSSKALTASSGKAARAKARSIAEVENKIRRSGEVLSTARRRSLPPRPPVSPEPGKTRCSWITDNSGGAQFARLFPLVRIQSYNSDIQIQHCRKYMHFQFCARIDELLQYSQAPARDNAFISAEPLYVRFHDEEWGVPVHDDRQLFEMLTLSQALAEHTWPVILSRRDEFREMVDGLNNASVSEFMWKRINKLLRSNGSMLLSEQKIRAVVTNAKQMQKVVSEFGSFSNYCWSFVNHRPITSSFRYARQVPSKTPRSEAMSKDMMRRGFQCVGPTTIYSFMQVAGIVNDHLSCCLRCHFARTAAPIPSNPAVIDPGKNVRAEPDGVGTREQFG